MIIHSDSLKPSVYYTTIMQSIVAYIKRVYIIEDLLYSCLTERSGLYINCTTLKLVVHITNTVRSVLGQAAALYTYKNVRY